MMSRCAARPKKELALIPFTRMVLRPSLRGPLFVPPSAIAAENRNRRSGSPEAEQALLGGPVEGQNDTLDEPLRGKLRRLATFDYGLDDSRGKKSRPQ